MSSFGMAISSYFGPKTQDFRLGVFQKGIDSLHETDFDGKVFVVDDGSSTKAHLDHVSGLNDDRFVVVEKQRNAGIGACKNTGIRHIMEAGFDVGFLADDDLVYFNGWDKAYLEAMSKTGIKHFCLWVEYLWTKNYGVPVEINGVQLRQTPHVNGAFLTFTRDMINEIGYFKKLPYAYGHEHSNFTLRCQRKRYMPFFADLNNSEKFIQLIPESGPQSSMGGPENINRAAMAENERHAMKIQMYEKCIE